MTIVTVQVVGEPVILCVQNVVAAVIVDPNKPCGLLVFLYQILLLPCIATLIQSSHLSDFVVALHCNTHVVKSNLFLGTWFLTEHLIQWQFILIIVENDYKSHKHCILF